MHPIVAPPPKHPIMYPTPNSADGTGDTLLTTGILSATVRLGLGLGLGLGLELGLGLGLGLELGLGTGLGVVSVRSKAIVT